MEEEYEKIREHAFTELEKAEAEPESKPEAEPEATEAEPEKPEAEKPKAVKKEKPTQPRMICEGCGRSYSIHTKLHVCRPPKGFEEKESPKQTLAPPPLNPPTPPLNPPPAIPGPAERQLTLSDVTEFLFEESKARREKRRDDLLAKMF